jgi:mannonate dehydratase
MKPLVPSWRWFGPDDPIPLSHIRQTGATGVVTSLHHLAPGTGWSDAEVAARRAEIAAEGLSWEVVESIPVTDEIKTRSGDWRAHVDAWCASVAALGRAGVPVVCYNFMPVLDWTRTELEWHYPNGARALRYDAVDCAMWDIHVLGRSGAAADHAPVAELARHRFETATEAEIEAIGHAILVGLPGADRGYSVAEFRERLALYAGVDDARLRANLAAFMAEVVPVAREAGVRLAIHPDDPPFPLFGLPRVVSVMADYDALFDAVPDPVNGMTLCAGSLGSRADNDVLAIARRFVGRIHFAHLRNVSVDGLGGFHEAAHLEGRVDMAALMAHLMEENTRRPVPIPFRPDHGHILGPDAEGRFNHGYTFAGRLRGLSELRGIEAGLLHAVGALGGSEAAE